MGSPSKLAKAFQRVLARIGREAPLRGFYLAGGNAIGAYFGHRTSEDLDLFSLDDSIKLDSIRNQLKKAIPELKFINRSDAVLKAELDGVPIDIVSYPYAPLERPKKGPAGFPIASLRDLAAMKVDAISSRGIRRDFWDLYEIIRHGLSLEQALVAYCKRFGREHSDLYHVIRSLTYFGDAEKAPEYPEGLTPRKWAAIKRFFEAEVPKLLLGIQVEP